MTRTPRAASDLTGQVALVTGGGRGIGANIARELAAAGMRVAVSARTLEQVEQVAGEIDGLAVAADVSSRDDVRAMVARVEDQLGPVDLLVANAGTMIWEDECWRLDAAEWWRVFEVNVLGVYLSCQAVIPTMIDRGRGRIVITSSGAAHLPAQVQATYASSKAAANRFGETLALQLAPHGIPVFPISPGLVRTEMTADRFDPTAPWASPEAAPTLVRELATGRFDALSGRYLHAEHDAPDQLAARMDDILRNDLNLIRLRS